VLHGSNLEFGATLKQTGEMDSKGVREQTGEVISEPSGLKRTFLLKKKKEKVLDLDDCWISCVPHPVQNV